MRRAGVCAVLFAAPRGARLHEQRAGDLCAAHALRRRRVRDLGEQPLEPRCELRPELLRLQKQKRAQ